MRLQEILKRLVEINNEIEKRGDSITAEDLTKFEAEVTALTEERKQLEAAVEKRSKILSAVAAGQSNIDGVGTATLLRRFGNTDTAEQQEERRKKNYRNAFFKRLLNRELTDEEKRDFSSVRGSAGGVMPEQTINLVIAKMKEKVPLLSKIQLLHVAGSVKFAVEGTVADATIHTENASIAADNDTLVTVTLAGYEIVKLVRISSTVYTMAVDAFEVWLVDMLTDKISEKIENYIVNGTGTNEPKGIAALTYVNNTNGVDYAGSKPTAAEVSKLIGLLPSRHARVAEFVMHRTTFFNDFVPIRDDAKAPIISGDAKNGFMIFGYPVNFSDSVTIGNVYFGNHKMVVGNLSQAINVKASEASGFAYNAIDYRGTAVFDCTIADNSAFVKGAATL